MVGGQPPVNVRRVGERHNIVKQADSVVGSRCLRKSRGTPEAWSHLCVCQAPFLITFAMGRIPHAGSRQSFSLRGLECKSRKSRNTWRNRQIWPWSTKRSRTKANGVLPRECTGNSKHQFPKTPEMTLYVDITRWSIPKSDWLHSLQLKMEKPYTVSKNKTGSWLWLRSWAPIVVKFRLKFKKVRKTTRPFRYDLNQIPYDYTVEVANRCKGLDLIECLKCTTL